jgi:hypothetical protein
MGTFPLFPLLPPELRALIWHATVEPRTVDIRVDADYSGENQHLHLVSPTPVPPTLQACREARNLGLYERAFSEIDADGRYVWVNWEMDIINIGTSYFSYFHPSAPLIKRLQFERDNTDDFFYHREVNDLDAFVNVKEIFIVCHGADGLSGWYGAVEEHTFLRLLGEENVYVIDMHNGGRILSAAEVDAIMDQHFAKCAAEDGYVDPTGEPLSSTST